MRKWTIVWLAVLIFFFGMAWPSTASAHGIGWWGPGLFFGGLALGTALAYPYYPYYSYPYYGAPYAPYAYSYPYPGPTLYEQAPIRSAPLVQRDVCYANGCYHLYGDGVTQPWQWVWTPATPAPPSPTP